MTWEKVALANLIQKPLTGEWGTGEGNIKVLRTTNFTNTGDVDFTNVVTRNINSLTVTRKKLQPGDIIIEKSGGGPNQPVGRVVYFNNKGIYLCNNFTSILRPVKDIVPKFLFWRLFLAHSKGETLRFQNKTTGIINLKLERYTKELEIILPPLHVQQQIADVLDKADALRQKDQKLLQKYDELVQSIFYDMFGDPTTSTKGLKVLKLKDVCLKITDGTHQSPKFISTGIPFLFVSNIKDDSIDYDSDKFISNEEYQILYKRTPIQIGDILLTTVGSYGNPAVVECNSKFMFQRHIAYLKLDPTSILPYFLFRQLKSRFVINQIESKVRGVAQKTLNLTDLNDIKIFVPKLEIQRSYGKVELLHRNMKAKALETFLKNNQLFETLMTKFFA